MGEFSKLWKEYDSKRNLEELRGALLERSKEEVAEMLIEYEKETVEKQIELVLKENKQIQSNSDWLLTALIFIFSGALYTVVLLEQGLEKWFEYVIALPGSFLVAGPVAIAFYFVIEHFQPRASDSKKTSTKSDIWTSIKLFLFGASIVIIGWIILYRILE